MHIEIIAVQHERIVCEQLHRDNRVLFERIALRHDDAHLILRKEEGLEFVIRNGADDADVDDPLLDRGLDDLRTVLIELDGDLRIVLLEFAQKLCKDMRIGDRRQPDLDGILLQVEFIFKIRLQMFKNKKTPLRIVQENGTRRCDLYRLCVADEKHDPQLILQRLDHAADGGLGNMKIARCFREALLFSDFHEIFQMTIIHCDPP